MSQEISAEQMIAELESFLESFRQYAKVVYSEEPTNKLEALASPLRIAEPKITDMISKVLGNGQFEIGVPFAMRGRLVTYSDLLGNALLGGNNAMPHNFGDFNAAVTQVLEKAIGTLKAGLWPPKTPSPVLVIRDAELRQRCADLLSAPGNYDRVVREATTILEDRMRRKPPFEILARLIPSSGDQIGENLVNKLFAPNAPILSISSDKTKRVAFYKMLIGAVSYLRNYYHHRLDAETEWSWAWSTVGFIDRLLADIDSCTLAEDHGGGS